MSVSTKNHINIAWWNVANFFHFRPEEVGRNGRWPRSRQEYDAKLSRVAAAVTELGQVAGVPDVLFLGELTEHSAIALRNKALPGYRVASLDVKRDEPTLQVAALFAPNSENVLFEWQPAIVVPATPRGTRPMAVLDLVLTSCRIRVIGCHWQSRFDEVGSDKTRFRLADFLGTYSYDFLHADGEKNHLVIVGDLNEEPFEHNLGTLYAHRNRGRARGREHWTDSDVKRVHLYNTSWRLLGEKHPHPIDANSTVFGDCAGTYYWESNRSWHHFDQLIVSGGLLESEAPYLDEQSTHIVSSPAFLTNGLPLKFSSDNGSFHGVSDHLPIVTRIII
jgi:endonuclease/exonuclease/phosphatase family metal-dependent hydrolase